MAMATTLVVGNGNSTSKSVARQLLLPSKMAKAGMDGQMATMRRMANKTGSTTTATAMATITTTTMGIMGMQDNPQRLYR